MSLTQIYPAQLPQHFEESTEASNSPIFLRNGILYQFLVDGVGTNGMGGGTTQVFIRQSVDSGVTWTDITPANPQKFEQLPLLGFNFIRIGDIVHLVQQLAQGLLLQIQVYRFDLATLNWLSDSTTVTTNATTSNFFNFAIQSAARSNGQIVIITGYQNDPGFSGIDQLFVYDSLTNTFIAGPVDLPALANTDVSGAGTDSAGRLHFFTGTWPGLYRNGGIFKAQHYVVRADNSITAAADIVTCTVTDINPNYPWSQLGLPVFYLDAATSQRMITLPVVVDNNTLNVYTAVEAEAPVWTLAATFNPPAGTIFANSDVSIMMVPTLLPVQFATATQLHVFWSTQNNQTGYNQAGPAYLQRASIRSGIVSATTSEFASLSTRLMPGPVYPILLSVDAIAGTAKIGGMVPQINGAVFGNPATKYSSLSQFWLSFAPVDTPVPAASSSPSGGGSPFACPPQGCEWLAGPKQGWGPVALVQQGKDVAVAYRARSDETFYFLLNPGWDVEQVVAAAARHIAEWERVPSGWNNPGGFTDEQGVFLQFRSMQDGYWALIEKIHEHFGMRETM